MINSGREWDWMNKNKINNIKELKGIANMKKYILKMWILAIVLLPFMPTKTSRKNHLIKRYNSAQAQEYVITIKHLRKSIK